MTIYEFQGTTPDGLVVTGSAVWSPSEQQYYIVSHDEYEFSWDVENDSVKLIGEIK